MYKNNNYIYDAAQVLEQLTGLSVNPESQRKICIDGHSFSVEVGNEIRKENEGFLMALFSPFDGKIENKIIVAKYIAIDTAQKLKANNINYLDISGNCYIKTQNLLIYILGQKIQRKQNTNHAKAFQEAGIRLIFHLLSNPENLQLPYRELAKLADISIGSVSNIMAELETQHFILKTPKKRVLKNKPELLGRWVIAYHDVLRPRLVKKQMKFVKSDNSYDWQSIQFNNIAWWGGEVGAAILTKHLNPEQFAIYTDENWQSLGPIVGLIPDNNGKVEVLQRFWKKEDEYSANQIVPPLLIYADLMGSGFGRNIEIAKVILENELQHIK